MKHLATLLLAAMSLIACQDDHPPAGFEAAPAPALWQAERADGARAWLFGTVHALPDGIDWRTKAVTAALRQSDVLVVEIADLEDEASRARIFHTLATDRAVPPIERRIDPSQRDAFRRILNENDRTAEEFDRTEDWAVALALAPGQPGAKSANGVDRALLSEFDGSVLELEGAARQLRLFDALPPAEQRDLLDAVIAAAADGRDRSAPARAWYAGDITAIARETRRGILADPELRSALLTDRNRRWVARIDSAASPARTLFVAVGAAHMAGEDGLPTLLAERGWTVGRVR